MSQSSLHDSIHADPNSPDALKQNVQIALEQVARIQSLARSCLHGIQHAYQAGSAEQTALTHALRSLAEFFRQTGIGAYPFPPSPESQSAPSPPTQQQLIDSTAREVQVLYEQLKRIQESSTVAANLLGAADTVPRAR
ncbi:hypothetical protein K503DRAFT_691477 [Rhizopogon vinicolor AM-OR11-026]|uniref:Uncharacterized protein n=1 Tax=Rhizopogon vinicolor AM-OR11-026 TaxID=1314800 RepID=A0A1B7N0V2_9AGAM|nr:hypothetical protein K503DRAFT_691477 [Rhizopogon vinicolor AM-OR11-026]